ncbi:MAG: hypothetical protein ABSG04_00640 [Verrucomicrobiota bacterium]|jgi:hypothetical protein
MSFRLKTNGWGGLAIGILALAACAAARANNSPSVLTDPKFIGSYPNVVTDPGFSGQSPDFQTGGAISPDWSYTPGFLNLGGTCLTLVSQTIPTPGALYIYDIDLKFGAAPPAQSMLFFIFWDGNLVGSVTDSTGWQDNNFLVIAAGPTSDLGFAGNSTAWATLGSLDVSFSGLIDPPPTVPDAPAGLGLEAAALLGLCGAAGFFRRPEGRSALHKAA